jgi:hypothetical protein
MGLDDNMAELIWSSSKQFDGVEYTSWSLQVELLWEQKQFLGIVDGTEEAPEDTIELKSWKKNHSIPPLTILLAVEPSF